MIAYFSKRLSPAEVNYITNNKELLGLVYFLKRFRCYLEGSTFEVLADNRALKHFFTKPHLSKREAKWLDLLEQFGITQVTFTPGKIHVLGDALSRVPRTPELPELCNFQILNLHLPKPFMANYKDHALFGPIYKTIKGKWPKKEAEKERISRLLHDFKLENELLKFNGRLCVPRKNVRDILHMAHDQKLSGHFGFMRTLSDLSNYHWKYKFRDVRRYCDGCQICQQNKDFRTKPLGIPQTLEVLSRRWVRLQLIL